MDPDATLKDLRECLEEPEDFEIAKELFQSLDQWLSTGGFLPKDWVKRAE